MIDFGAPDLSRGHGAGFIGSLAGHQVLGGEPTPANLRQIADKLLRHAGVTPPEDDATRIGRALFIAAGLLEDLDVRLAAVERAVACTRECEGPGCTAVYCEEPRCTARYPAAWMVSCPDGSWFCPAHAPADPDSPILPQSLAWAADRSAAPAGA